MMASTIELNMNVLPSVRNQYPRIPFEGNNAMDSTCSWKTRNPKDRATNLTKSEPLGYLRGIEYPAGRVWV